MLKGHVDKDSQFRDIVFTDYGQASAFAHWIRYSYNTRIRALSPPAGASMVPFKMTDIVCIPEDKSRTVDATYRAKPTSE